MRSIPTQRSHTVCPSTTFQLLLSVRPHFRMDPSPSHISSLCQSTYGDRLLLIELLMALMASLIPVLQAWTSKPSSRICCCRTSKCNQAYGRTDQERLALVARVNNRNSLLLLRCLWDRVVSASMTSAPRVRGLIHASRVQVHVRMCFLRCFSLQSHCTKFRACSFTWSFLCACSLRACFPALELLRFFHTFLPARLTLHTPLLACYLVRCGVLS